MTPDPLGYADGFDLWQYAGGDPINFVDPFGLSMTTSTAPKPVEPESGRGAEARRQRAARHLMGQSGDGGGKKPPPDSQTGCKGNANCQNAAAKLKAAGKDPFANGFKRKWQDYGAGATDDFCAMMDGIDTPLCRKQEAPEGATLFPNLLPELLKQELETATEQGIAPTDPSQAGFEELANSGTLKWVVTEGGDLKIVPKYGPEGAEVPHTVASGGAPVQAAGEAEISVADGQRYGVSIDNHSGHYQPSAESLAVGRSAFESYGIRLP